MSIQDFQIVHKLGEGSFGSVYKAKRLSSGQEYAIKKMSKLNEKDKENALNEVRILASVQHPHIASYKEAFFDNSTSELCLVMEFAEGGDLMKKVNQHQQRKTPIPEDQIWKWTIQILLGLKALHDKNIFHRDIKCANIFLSKQNDVKLGDLNVSKVAKKGLLMTQTGTPYYASPEIWKDKPYDSRSDVWSVGCIVYELCCLRPPFTAPDMQGLYRKIIKGIYPDLPSSYSSDISNLIKNLLQTEAYKRPTVDNLFQMPLLRKYMTQEQIKMIPQKSEDDLLGTIKLPRNLNLVRLPKSNYDIIPSIQLPLISRNAIRSAASAERRNPNNYLKYLHARPRLESIQEKDKIRLLRDRSAQNVDRQINNIKYLVQKVRREADSLLTERQDRKKSERLPSIDRPFKRPVVADLPLLRNAPRKISNVVF